MLAHGLERIVVEETVAGERDTGDYPVVQRALIDIGIFCIARGEKHAVVPIDIRYGGTCLAISRMVVKLVVRTETLALCTRTDAACDVELARRHIVPDPGYGIEVGRIVGQRRHIGHAGKQISGAHGMSHNLVLGQYGLVVLRILAQAVAVRASACFLHKIFGRLKILVVAGHLIQFGKGHFCYRMARRHMLLPLVGTEDLAYEVGVLYGHVEKRALARGEIVGHGGFIQMTAVVQFVAVDFLPSVRTPPSRKPGTLVGHACSQIAVRFLRGGDKGNHTVEICVKVGIILHGQRI